MKLMFISDIHGIKTNLHLIKYKFDELKCDKLIILGDLFYLGPGKKIKDDYDSGYVLEFLNNMSDKILCVRGNCDSTIDLESLKFPVIKELSLIIDSGINIFITHGHIYNPSNLGKINTNIDTVLVYGHEHIPYIKRGMNMTFINVGSVSLPKDNNKPTYMIYENKEFSIFDMEGNTISRIRI